MVLDASAALEYVLGRNYKDQVAADIAMADKVFAPELYYAETGNALWKHVQANIIDRYTAEHRFNQACKLIDYFTPLEKLSTEALAESCRLGHPIYDMYYFVLARRQGAHLVSLDKRLLQLAKEQGLRYTRYETIPLS
jgi:predicted nucleic acid-binding protein